MNGNAASPPAPAKLPPKAKILTKRDFIMDFPKKMEKRAIKLEKKGI